MRQGKGFGEPRALTILCSRPTDVGGKVGARRRSLTKRGSQGSRAWEWRELRGTTRERESGIGRAGSLVRSVCFLKFEIRIWDR